jgi:hypothetical protein
VCKWQLDEQAQGQRDLTEAELNRFVIAMSRLKLVTAGCNSETGSIALEKLEPMKLPTLTSTLS